MVLPPPEDERTPKRGAPSDEQRRQSPRFTEQDLQAFKYFDLLQPLLQRLHGAGTERDRAGNRRLFFDQYASLLLLYFFNPVITSLRGIQHATGFRKVQRELGTSKTSLGSLSEAVGVFDAELIALAYRYRWQIELFFRWLKLISLWVGRKPTKRTYETLCFYFLGVVELDELTDHIATLKRHQ
jgi:hypothetical protein